MAQMIKNDEPEIIEANEGGKIVGTLNPTPTDAELQLIVLNGSIRTVSAGIDEMLMKLGVEPTLTVREAAAILRWSYSKTRRYFRCVEGICVCYQPKRYKRAYRAFTIPISVFAREWQKMTGQEPESAQLIRQRLIALVKYAGRDCSS